VNRSGAIDSVEGPGTGSFFPRAACDSRHAVKPRPVICREKCACPPSQAANGYGALDFNFTPAF